MEQIQENLGARALKFTSVLFVGREKNGKLDNGISLKLIVLKYKFNYIKKK